MLLIFSKSFCFGSTHSFEDYYANSNLWCFNPSKPSIKSTYLSFLYFWLPAKICRQQKPLKFFHRNYSSRGKFWFRNSQPFFGKKWQIKLFYFYLTGFWNIILCEYVEVGSKARMNWKVMIAVKPKTRTTKLLSTPCLHVLETLETVQFFWMNEWINRVFLERLIRRSKSTRT